MGSITHRREGKNLIVFDITQPNICVGPLVRRCYDPGTGGDATPTSACPRMAR